MGKFMRGCIFAGLLTVLLLIPAGVSASEPSPPAQQAEDTLPAGTDVPDPAETDVSDPVQQKVPQVKRIKGVKNVKLLRYSTTSIKVQWDPRPKAKYYRVYRAAKKNGNYKKIAVTKNTHYRDKGLKKNKKYFYKVQACVSKKVSAKDSILSTAVSMKTRTYSRTTVLAGDSVMLGMAEYGTTKYMNIGGNKRVVAKVGTGTLLFPKKRVFGGMTGPEKIISLRPYRLYIMLGLNEVTYRRMDDMMRDYKKIICQIQQKCPDTDIVLLPVSPVSRGALAKRKNLGRIGTFNKNLKTLAKTCNVKYFDYTDVLKDSAGYLKYNGGDGEHWNITGYKKFAEALEKYDLQQD